MKTKILMVLMAVILVFHTSSTAPEQTKTKIQIAILLDTSNSMDGLIDQAKAQLWKIVNEMSLARYKGTTPDLEIALYEYGNDNLPSEEGFIRMVVNMTNDLDLISEDLFALKTLGGEEFCGQVVQKAIQQLNWSSKNNPNDLRLIFIAGNEPYDQGSVKFVKSATQAKDKDVVVSTIFCGNYEEGIETHWKKGATLTGGRYLNINQNQKTVYIESPYDDQIIELNKKLNKTYIVYGQKGLEMQTRQSTQDANAMGYSKSNYVNRSVSKSSKNYSNKHWDLVDQSQEKDFDISKIKEKYLPEEMKKMDKKQREEYILLKQKEREKIKAEINPLDAKRRKYVAEERKKSAVKNTLDEVMLKAVRELALEKNYTFEK